MYIGPNACGPFNQTIIFRSSNASLLLSFNYPSYYELNAHIIIYLID